MKRITILAMLVLTGCVGIPKPDTTSWAPSTRDTPHSQFWKPTKEEQSHAEQLGRWFAFHTLGISRSDVQIMRPHVSGRLRDGRPVLKAEFIDPGTYFKKLDGGKVKGMVGAGPICFRIWVDAENWTIVDHQEIEN